MPISITKPTVGASQDTWGTTINTALDSIVTSINNLDDELSDLDNTVENLNFFPAGGIILWSGSVADIPSGWVLCDGTNSTPDLRNRFVVGAGDTYSVDGTGGNNSTTLTNANLPAHTHSFSGNTNTASLTGSANNIGEPFGNYGNANGIFSKSYSASSGTPQNADTSATGTLNINASHSHSFSGTTGSAGSGSSFDNRPAYYALAYIMKT